MKKQALLLLVLVAVAAAQGPQARPMNVAIPATAMAVSSPTYSDMYCAGYITNQPPSKALKVVGGVESPHATKFGDRDLIFLAGEGFQPGSQFTILRHLKDPNKSEAFRGQRALITKLGEPYAEMGRARVMEMRGSQAVAEVEFSCDAIMPGDVVVPWVDKPSVQYRNYPTIDRTSPANGKPTGRVVMGKNFETYVGAGYTIYLSIGGNEGIKPGDYFRVVRTFDPKGLDEVERLSIQTPPSDDTQAEPMAVTPGTYASMPRKVLGEMIVLSVSPTSSTAILTRSLEAINVGDMVEMMDPPPAAPMAAAAPSSAPVPPTISCSATPANVRAGEAATVTCNAMSNDNRPLSFSFMTDRGTLRANGNVARLETAAADEGGPINVTATVSDDRNLMASAGSTITVAAAPPPPMASKANDLRFKMNSSRVDNASKAMLDDIALRMQRETGSTAVVMTDSMGANGNRLATLRGNNIKTYLVQSKGIDAARVKVQAGNGQADRTEVWIVPPGAPGPQ